MIVRRRSAGRDAHGDPIDTPAVDVRLRGVFTAPRMSTDVDDVTRAGVIVGLWLFGPIDTDVRHDDEIVVDGVPYRVDGEPGRWSQPMTGWRAGMQVALVRAEG